MKQFLYSLLLLVCIGQGIALSGCDSDNNPDGPIEKRLYNENDSIVLCKIIEDVTGLNFDGLKSLTEIEEFIANSPNKYIEAYWIWIEEEQQYYLAILRIDARNRKGPYLTIPENVGTLKYLRTLSLMGQDIVGDLPESICSLERLSSFELYDTRVTGIPDGLFSPRFYWVIVGHNSLLTRVPSSVTGLMTTDARMTDSDLPGNIPGLFQLYRNGFVGKCPKITTAVIDLEDNNFSSMDWYNAVPHDTIVDGIECHAMVYLAGNRLTGDIPDWILNDPYSMGWLEVTAQNQQPGYGLNFPKHKAAAAQSVHAERNSAHLITPRKIESCTITATTDAHSVH